MGYVGTLMGKVFGIDLKTGAMKWTFEGDGYKNKKKKYFDAEDNHPEKVLEKFDNFDNVLRIYTDLGGVFSTPLVTNDYLVFTAVDGYVYCLAR